MARGVDQVQLGTTDSPETSRQHSGRIAFEKHAPRFLPEDSLTTSPNAPDDGVCRSIRGTRPFRIMENGSRGRFRVGAALVAVSSRQCFSIDRTR